MILEAFVGFLEQVQRHALVDGLALLLACSLGAHAQDSQPLRPPLLSRAGSEESRLWKSQTTGKEYRVRVENDRLYAEWANMPVVTARQGASIRTECQRLEGKWVGTSRIFLPCTVGSGRQQRTNRCRMTMRFEITSMTPSRIVGRVENPRIFDCERCQVVETEWKDFVWVPKQ